MTAESRPPPTTEEPVDERGRTAPCAGPPDDPLVRWCLHPGRDAPDVSTHALAALVTVGNGTMAASGDVAGVTGTAMVAGVYGIAGDMIVRPLPGAPWTRVEDDRGRDAGGGAPDGVDRWVLDLRRGVLRSGDVEGGRGTERFVSLVRTDVGVLRASRPAPAEWATPATGPVATVHVAELVTEERSSADEAIVGSRSDRCNVVTVARQRHEAVAGIDRLERLVAVRAGADAEAVARRDLAAAEAVGVAALEREHVAEWARRWDGADVTIGGDDEAQLAVRVALFHLLSCAATDGESAVGARGLSGTAYAGHVFWDTDVFVLPALAATLPDAARSVLAYRANRLGAARRRAASEGRPGARFPWESADTGDEVTPSSAIDLDGTVVPILTGTHAIHIGSDIAWSIRNVADWTGDTTVLDGVGREIVVETADYLASRIRLDERGVGHLDGVIGPDEYHGIVDDNAYTNRMARWHLRLAAGLDPDTSRAQRFRSSAAALTDGFDATAGRHLQFAGYDELDDVRIAELCTVPVAADVLLGAEPVRRSTIIKQPDVLMAHHLLDDGPPGSLDADLDHYLPRTAHGSSLSPAVCAALLARAGRPDEAMRWFDVAARLDLDDLTGTTGGGIHLATMGGLWQAVVRGFAGLRPTDAGLVVAPSLPTRWESLAVTVRYRGAVVRVTVTADHVVVDCDGHVPLIIGGQQRVAPLRVPYGVISDARASATRASASSASAARASARRES